MVKKYCLAALACLVACFTWSLAFSQASTVVLNPEVDEIDAAMLTGDLDRLRALADAADANTARKELISAYMQRTAFDIQASSAHAKRCIALSLGALASNYQSNVRCHALLAGNSLIEGDYSTWSSRLRSGLDDVKDYVREVVAREVPGQYTRDVEVYLPGVDRLPALKGVKHSISGPTTAGNVVPRVRIPMTHAQAGSTVALQPFYVNARINGADAIFALDTGSSATVIGGKTAKALGLRPMPEHRVSYRLGFENRQVLASIQTIQRLELGSFTVEDPTLLISDDVSVTNVIGLDILGAMGGLKFSSSKLEFASSKRCQGRATLASDLFASNRYVVAQVVVDGRRVSADVDTGNWERITIYGDVPAGTKPISINGLTPAPASIVKKGNHVGSQFNLGAGILEDFDMMIDLKHGKFCLEKKG